MKICLIWGTEAETVSHQGSDGSCVISSRAGGGYFLTGTAKAILKSKDDAFKARLTTWLIDQHRLDTKFPMITGDILGDIEQRPALSVHVRAERLLDHLQSLLPDIGVRIGIFASGRHEDMLAMTESLKMNEVIYLLDYLEDQQYIEKESHRKGWIKCSISPDGHAHLAGLKTQVVVDSRQAFVAMWFHTSMDTFQKAVYQGIQDAGYKPLRIDKEHHNDKIDDRIIAEIKRSRFIVADFTHGEFGVRGGVYYEAGFARGLNIPVIFTCREDMIEKIHFDTRQYNHILWEAHKPDEFKQALSERISATIEDGPITYPEGA